MSRPVLMSIRAEYAARILDGLKIWEFRKGPVPKPGTLILIYRSGVPAARGVVGSFIAGEVTSGTAEDHLSEVTGAGIGLAGLIDYAGSRQRLIWRIEITGLWRLREVQPLSVLGVARAPQSWQYLDAQVVADFGLRVSAPFPKGAGPMGDFEVKFSRRWPGRPGRRQMFTTFVAAASVDAATGVARTRMEDLYEATGLRLELARQAAPVATPAGGEPS